MPNPLHPNLARLAAAYDEIIERHRTGRISARQAYGEVSALVGRDDSGLLWTIDPSSGRWSFRSLNGELVASEPPRFGIASPTPAELGAGGPGDLDQRISFFPIDEDQFTLQAISEPVGVGQETGKVRRLLRLLQRR